MTTDPIDRKAVEAVMERLLRHASAAAKGAKSERLDGEVAAYRVVLSELAALPTLARDGGEEPERLRAALAWYAEKVAACRKLTSEGDAARQELDRDGGSRARAALGEHR